jgi:uncharacterized protein with NRDE domain
MCIVFFKLFVVDGKKHLILAANRDEFEARPTSRMRCESMQITGRDTLRGGVWVSVGNNLSKNKSRFAFLTNVRIPFNKLRFVGNVVEISFFSLDSPMVRFF